MPRSHAMEEGILKYRPVPSLLARELYKTHDILLLNREHIYERIEWQDTLRLVRFLKSELDIFRRRHICTAASAHLHSRASDVSTMK